MAMGTKVADSSEAARIMVESLEERYGEGFSAVRTIDPFKSPSGGLQTYTSVMSPSSLPGRTFTAGIGVDPSTGEAATGVVSTYSQYLFKERAERDFLGVLEGCEGLAGYAAVLMGVHFDDSPWGESDFDAYMGSSGEGDPYVAVYLMMPAAGSASEWAAVAEDCFQGLYALERSMWVYVGVEGHDVLRDCLRSANTDEMYPENRREAPGESVLLEDFTSARPDEFRTVWDGAGNGDGVPRDPGVLSVVDRCLPHITWNPGYGPEHW